MHTNKGKKQVKNSDIVYHITLDVRVSIEMTQEKLRSKLSEQKGLIFRSSSHGLGVVTIYNSPMTISVSP